MKEKKESPPVAVNRKARHFYEILETFEAGLALEGAEVKSLRLGRCSFAGAFARVDKGEAWLHHLHIPPYAFSQEALDPRRTRKLLLKKREIEKIAAGLQKKGLTLIPLEVYFKRGWAKALMALARGKTGPDRREDVKKRDMLRELRKR